MNNTFTSSKASLYRFSSLMNPIMVIDISSNPNDLNKAIIYQWHGGSNQRFAIRQLPGAKFAIFSAKNNMVLIPEAGSSQEGARILLGQPKKIQSQFWTIQQANHPKLGNRKGYIIKSHCGKALDVFGAKCKNQQRIVQWPVNGNDNQIWIIQQV